MKKKVEGMMKYGGDGGETRCKEEVEGTCACSVKERELQNVICYN